MNKIMLAAAAAIALTAGVAQAQTTTETTTTQSTVPYPVPAPMPPAPQVSQSTVQHTVDSDGVVTDHSKTVTSGTQIGPLGDTTSTRRTVETTSSH